MKQLVLKPGELGYQEIVTVLTERVQLSLDNSAIENIQRSRQVVSDLVACGKTTYGINTGFGHLANTSIEPGDLCTLQRNLLLSHATGCGSPLSDDIVRLIMVLKINSLARGYSGVSLELIEHFIALFNADILPVIPEKGSVGASGDLVPLAHMALALIGEGDVVLDGKVMPCAIAIKEEGLKPIELGPKEGLALINGMQVSNAMGLKALMDSMYLFEAAMVSGCLSTEALMGSDTPFDARIHEARGHKGQIACAKVYRELLRDSEIRSSHVDCERVQDPYSIRCQPQVMGACLEQLWRVQETFCIEANAVSDNPVVFADQGDIVSGGNFHGEVLAINADLLALAISEIGALSERRVALLIDSHLSGLPPFLVKKAGVNSGFMIAHVTAAALASDNKALSHPHCVDSLPTSANQEDHVSMATNACRRLYPMIDNVANIVAIELLAACQGVEFRRPLMSSEKLEHVFKTIRKKSKAFETDRYFAPDIALLKEDVKAGVFASGLL
jgi:histidine ammonia-lyase